MLRFVASASVFVAAVLLAPRVRADDAAAARAQTLFREGRSALEKGDVEGGCRRFEQSLAILESAAALLNLADCEERRGHLVAAKDVWQKGMDRLPPGDERIAFAQKRMTTLEATTPRLTVRLAAGAPPDIAVERDGVAVPANDLGAPWPLDPGQHVVVVRSASQPMQRLVVTLAPGQSKEILVASTVREVVHEVRAPERGNVARTLGFVFVGVGIAGLGAAAVTGALVVSNDATVKAECPTPTTCSKKGSDAAHRGDTLIAANTVSFVAAGVAGAAGATLLFVSSRSGNKVAATGFVTPDGGGLSLRGSF